MLPSRRQPSSSPTWPTLPPLPMENLFPTTIVRKSRSALMTVPLTNTAWALTPQAPLGAPTLLTSQWWSAGMKLLPQRQNPKNMILSLRGTPTCSEVPPRTTRSSHNSLTLPTTDLSTRTSTIAYLNCWKRQRIAMQRAATSSVVRERIRSNWRFLRMNSKRIPTGPASTSDAFPRSSASASARSTSGTGTRGRKRAWQSSSIKNEESDGITFPWPSNRASET